LMKISMMRNVWWICMIDMSSGFEGLQRCCEHLLVAQDQQKRILEILLHEKCERKIKCKKTWRYVTVLGISWEMHQNGDVNRRVYFPFHSGGWGVWGPSFLSSPLT
jgi:hypothetical protein